jgi:hypothetical protein
MRCTFRGISGKLSSEGHFNGTLRRIGVEGQTDVPDFAVKNSSHQVELRTLFQAHVDARNGDVFLESVRASFGKTTLAGEGSIAEQAGRSIFLLDLLVQDVQKWTRSAFCPGNEHVAGPELMRIASPAQCGWSLRVLSEKRASSSGKEIRRNSGAEQENGSRVQEIIIETHDHSLDLALLPEAQFSAIMRTVKERYDQLSAEPSLGACEHMEEPGETCWCCAGTFALRASCYGGGAASSLKVDATSVL